MKPLTSGEIATILGAAPQIGDIPRDTPLALWWRMRNGDRDPFEAQKTVSRAIESGLRGMMGEESGQLTVVKVCLWYTADQLAVDGPPPYLLACVQDKLIEAGLHQARVGVLFAGGIWCSWSMRAVPEFQASIMAATAEFMSALLSGQPPAVMDEGDLSVTRKLWAKDMGHEVALPAEAIKCWERMKKIRGARRSMAKDSSVLEARLRAMMGSAAVGRIASKRLGYRTIKTPSGTPGRRLVEL